MPDLRPHLGPELLIGRSEVDAWIGLADVIAGALPRRDRGFLMTFILAQLAHFHA